MRKKFTMLLASLFCCVGAMKAQVLTTTIELGKEYTLRCKATDHEPFIADDGSVVSGRASVPTNIVFEASDTEGCYYMKSVVSGRYINCDGTNVTADAEKSTVWKATSYTHTANVISLSCPDYADKYLNNNHTGTSTGTSGLKMNNHSGGPDSGRGCSLWYLRESVSEVASGKVYRIVNKANENSVITETSNFILGTAATSDSDKSQLWYVEGSNVEGYTFRNLSTANYFNYVDEIYTLWGTAGAPAYFYLTKVDDYLAITFDETAQLSGYKYAHYSNGNVVRWQAHDNTNNVDASLWTFEEVSAVDAVAAWDDLYQDWCNGISTKLAEANSLIATAGFGVNAMELTTSNTTCPAAIADNSDGGGVPALLDDDNSSFMHTKYNGKGSVGEPHYIQVDLGEGNSAKYITFSYRARHNNQNNNPETIIVKGSIDGESYTDIQTLTNLPDGLIDYESSVVGNGTAYRYFRFVVTATSNEAKHEGYVFFSLAKFRMNTVTINDDYASKKSVLKKMKDWLSENEYTEERPDEWCLKVAEPKEEEISALIYGATPRTYPFTLTTDVNDPICYHIKSGRSKDWNGNYYWTFIDGKVTTITANDDYAKDVETYWFFMENPETGMLQFVPFIENNNPMGYVAVNNDGADKITNVSTTSGFVGTAYELVTAATNDSFSDYPYALRPYGSNTYISNHGGTGSKYMGVYNGFKDGGTRFAVEEVTITPSSKLRDLRSTIAEAQGYEGSTVLGEYTEASVATLNTALGTAQAVYDDATTATDETCQTQIDAITTAKGNLAVNLPQAGKFYRIMNNGGTGYLSTGTGTGTGRTQFVAGIGEHASSIFYYTGEKLVDYTTGLYLVKDGNNMLAYTNTVGEAAGTIISFAKSPVLGKLLISFDNGNRSFYSNAVGESNAASSGQTGEHYRFTVSEVTWLPIPMSTTVGYATLCSPVALSTYEYGSTTDHRVEAYVIHSTGADYVTLTRIDAEDGVIPANTPVILKYVPGATYDNEKGAVYLEVSKSEKAAIESKLEGTLADAYVAGPAYVLSAPTVETVGLYKAKLNKDGEGNAVEGEPGTHFLNNGFKAYLVVEGANAPMFSFGRGEGTTGIDNAQLTIDNVVIYDLLGRRVEKMEKGIYIVNGKKVIK